MDPLSLTASIIAIVGVGGQAAGAVRKLAALKNAPELILALNNEITDLHLVVSAIQDVYQRQRNWDSPSPASMTSDINTSITSSLQHAINTTAKLEVLYGRLKISSAGTSTGPIKFNTVAWLREQRNIRQIQQDLRSVRIKLAGALSILNSDILLRLGKNIDGLHSELKNLSLAQQQSIQAELQSSVIQETTARSLNDRIDRLDTAHQRREAAQELRLGQRLITIQETMANLPAFLKRVDFKLSAMEAARIASTAESVIREASPSLGNSVAPSIPMDLPNLTSIQISTTGLAINCFPNCICVCHRTHTRRSPTLMERFLGILFLGYCGLPCVTPECDNSKCLHRSSPRALVMYRFPTWLLARAFLFTARWSVTHGIEINLRIPRMLSRTARIFIIAEHGDVENMKAVFRHGLGSPFDSDWRTGETPLMTAVSNSRLHLCQFLLHAGADPHREIVYGRSASKLAWAKILNRATDIDTRNRLRSLFPDGDYLENQDFSLVHKTVLGLNLLNLDILLTSVPKSVIDACDVDGRTALFWAARHGNYNAMLLLLKHGADAHKATNNGYRPLDATVYARNQPCTRLLLEYMASANYIDPLDLSPLHSASHRGLDLDIIGKLINLGCDIDAIDGHGYTPFMHSVQENHYTLCQYILSQRPNPKIVNNDGESILHIAVCANSHQSLQLLLPQTDFCLKTKTGETLFHYAAQYADAKTLEILIASNLYGIDTNDVIMALSHVHKIPNLKGMNGMQVAELRTDVTPEWHAMYRTLKHKLECPGTQPQAALQSEPEEFHDALESQDQ